MGIILSDYVLFALLKAVHMKFVYYVLLWSSVSNITVTTQLFLLALRAVLNDDQLLKMTIKITQ